MNESSFAILVLATRQEEAELVNRTLRDAGHRVRCEWIQRTDAVADALAEKDPQLLIVFADNIVAIRDVAKTRQLNAPMVPMIVVRKTVDEAAISEVMAAGAQDLVSTDRTQRLCAVAERELRAYRLERALNETLSSAAQYRKQLKSFLAGTVDAIAHVQEGIVVEANQAWASLFGLPDAEAAHGPLMDHFGADSQPALKGALIACRKGQWGNEPLKVTAIGAEGMSMPLKLTLEATTFEREPAIKLSVPREVAQRKEPEELVEQAIHMDPTTGFYNRRRFIELLTDRLDTTPRGGMRALAYIRPDKFGEIEDEVGPLASEEIIVQLAHLLRSLSHDNDVCGRFGGTVFTMVVERGTLRDAEAWAGHVIARIREHMFDVANKSLSLTCTIGIAEIGQGTDRVEGLISEAGRANERGRKRGGNQLVLEETSDESTRVQRFDALWVTQIKAALLENRFKLAHMPVVSLTGKAAKIYDTVLRMIDAQGDEVAATEFIAAAGRNSLLRPIDRWVIATSVARCATQDIDLVFVKLSHDSVLDASLLDWIKQIVAENKVNPSSICFQVTEENATQYLKQTNALAEQLKAAGYYFAIEHFGIGRDPMRILSQMAMNYLKIDGSLMQSISVDGGLQEKVRNFVKAAEKRKILTIAERVEDANTMAVLFQLGVSYMEGHYVHEAEVILEEQVAAAENIDAARNMDAARSAAARRSKVAK
jgi:diguanylate cyclase (GGDEF)-like protein